MDFPGGSVVKNLLANQENKFSLCVGKITQRREWLPTPVFSSGELYGQKSYSPWGHKRVGHYLATKQQKQQ